MWIKDLEKYVNYPWNKQRVSVSIHQTSPLNISIYLFTKITRYESAFANLYNDHNLQAFNAVDTISLCNATQSQKGRDLHAVKSDTKRKRKTDSFKLVGRLHFKVICGTQMTPLRLGLAHFKSLRIYRTFNKKLNSYPCVNCCWQLTANCHGLDEQCVVRLLPEQWLCTNKVLHYKGLRWCWERKIP